MSSHYGFQGGFREPAIAWWPGKIKAGSSTEAIGATYDLFPTVLKLAGVALPPNREYDGIDLAKVRMNTGLPTSTS